MTKIEFAQRVADNAKADYIQKLKQADSALRAEVSRDPSLLGAAQWVQSSYGEGIPCEALAASEQPAESSSEPVQHEGVVARVVKKIKGQK